MKSEPQNQDTRELDVAVPPIDLNLAPDSIYLRKPEVRKLYLQLRHGTLSSVENYIRAAGMWDKVMDQKIADVIGQCECQLAFEPRTHVKVAPGPPSTEQQARISIDVIYLGGKN